MSFVISKAVEYLQNCGVSCELVGTTDRVISEFVPIQEAGKHRRTACFYNKSPEMARLVFRRAPALIVCTPAALSFFKQRDDVEETTFLLIDNPRLGFSLLNELLHGCRENLPRILDEWPDWVELGERVEVGNYTVLGCEGLNANKLGDILNQTPHYGKLIIENDVRIHSFCAIERAIMGETRIKKGCIIDHHVVIGHGCVIGERCQIAPGALVLGSCTIGNDVGIGAGAIIKEGTTIGDNCFIGMGAIVLKDIPKDLVVIGNPGRIREDLKRPW